jgi:hypothetical protein
MRDRKHIQVVAGLVTLAALASLAVTWHGPLAPSLDSTRHKAAGWGLAQHTLRLLKSGGQVTVITRDTSEFKNPAADVLLASFSRTLRKARVPISSIHSLQIDPLRPLEVPTGDFQEWIRKAPSGSVIVSFMGPPLLSQAQRNQLGEIKPAVVAFCPGTLPGRTDFRALFAQGLLQAAVVSRQNPSATSQGLQGRFDQLFVILTAANAADVSW